MRQQGSNDDGSGAIDWRTFLTSWHDEARLAVARSLARHGIAGPAAFGIQEYVTEAAKRSGASLDASIFAPLTIEPATSERIDEALREARTRLDSISQQVDVREVVSYEWAVIRNDGLLSPPASEQQIVEAERNLNAGLPRSYREFLQVSNGWLASSSRLVAASELGRFGRKDPAYVKDWSQQPPGGIPDAVYFVYGKDQLPYNIRSGYLPDSLLISQPLTEVNERLLLNPQVTFGAEWEAWRMSPQLPGAIRYRTFPELMQSLHRSDLNAWRQLELV